VVGVKSTIIKQVMKIENRNEVIRRSRINFLSSPVSFSCRERGFASKVTTSQRSLLNKLQVYGKIISCHKTPLRENNNA